MEGGGPDCLRGLLTPRRHLPLLPCNRLLFNIVRRKTTDDSPAPWGMCHPFQEFCIKGKEVNMKEKKDEWRRATGTFTTRPMTVALPVTLTEYLLCIGRSPNSQHHYLACLQLQPPFEVDIISSVFQMKKWKNHTSRVADRGLKTIYVPSRHSKEDVLKIFARRCARTRARVCAHVHACVAMWMMWGVP